MLQFRRIFETEKNQLQQLNSRLAQYLSRTKQLEHENACLITEINKLRQVTTVEQENHYKTEMRELRRMVDQLSFEKSQAEMEKEQLWREFQMVQSMCREEADVCKSIGGQFKGCEKELQHAYKTNDALEQRLLQLESEYKCLEEAHKQEIAHLRGQVHARVIPVVTQTYQGPPAASMEEIQEYARSLSEGWIETVEMYQQKVEEMERSIKEDQARLADLQREKMLYASDFEKLRVEAQNQSQIQLHLEEELMQMQEKFRAEFSEYQMIIDQLEHERNMLADNIAEKMREHENLLQVKMDLGMEVAAYRALLEGERIDIQEAQRRMNVHHRERIIDIKKPSHPYTAKASSSTRHHLDFRYMEPTSNLRRSPVPQSGSISPSRVIPISVTGRAQHQSPAARRDMVAFTKARASASATSTTTSTTTPDTTTTTTTTRNVVVQSVNKSSQDMQKKVAEEKSTRIKEAPQSSVKNKSSPVDSSAADHRSVKVVSPPETIPDKDIKVDSRKNVSVEKEGRGDSNRSDINLQDDVKPKTATPSEKKKILDSVSVEEIIEKVIKPAGMDAKVSSSGDSKITYHVEKTEQEDGTTKTQIVLESKVEEELDMLEDTALDDLLSRGAKKVCLEDIKGTETESMIQNLLSGLHGGDMANKSVNVEIIEEPVESHSDEEYEFEQKSVPKFSQPSSTVFQIEELENVPHDSKFYESGEDSLKSSETASGRNGSVQVEEGPRESESSYFQDQEDSNEYFVSTPDENMSEPEDGGGITSYGHYGVVDDLSDERYYQDEGLPLNRMTPEKSDEYKFLSDDHSFVKDTFPECIIEEEVRVSPTVQESMLGFLKEDSLDPKDQLKGALEQLQDSVSGPLKEELAFISRVSSSSPENMAINVKKVHQADDTGTTTIVAELNISQSLEDFGRLEGGDLSEEQILEALKGPNPELQRAFQGGAEGGYSVRITRDEGLESFPSKGETITEVTEKHIQLGPTEKSFTFQMDNGQAQPSSEQVLQSHAFEPPLTVTHEKKVATVYLESTVDDQ